MAKINKVYPPFFNGVSQQSPELVLDSQCKEMKNCVPSIVEGLTKRPPAKFKARRDFATYEVMENATTFHTYDRGEDNEEYIFVQTNDANEPLLIYNKEGEDQTIVYDSTNEATIKTYLNNLDLKGLTVQDRTWLLSKNATVGLDTTGTEPLAPNYTKEAFYWLKRGSGDKYNPFNYAVYLDNITYECAPNKPSGSDSDPATGFEDSDYAATELTAIINAESHETRFFAQNIGSIIKIIKGTLSSNHESTNDSITVYDDGYSKIQIADDTSGTNAAFYAMSDGQDRLDAQTRITQGHKFATGGTTITWIGLSDVTPVDNTTYLEYTIPNINYYNDNNENYYAQATHDIQEWENDNDFTFSSWDSWGNQASEGWKGTVNKLTDLPKDMPFDDVYVKIQGDEDNTFQEYFVKWNGSSWEECLDPEANRGVLTNMPIKCDRTDVVPTEIDWDGYQKTHWGSTYDIIKVRPTPNGSSEWYSIDTDKDTVIDLIENSGYYIQVFKQDLSVPAGFVTEYKNKQQILDFPENTWEWMLYLQVGGGSFVHPSYVTYSNYASEFTLNLIDWSAVRVGNEDNNPDPSFVNNKIQDIFFYKNRLGFASEDSVALSETANYTNFYATTAIDVLDTDMIDVTIATNQASRIYHVKPFNNSLYVFTKYAQYELVAEGAFTPNTVSMSNTSNYPMAVEVAPIVVNDSLYFISTSNNRQQLREYIKTEKLNVTGVDLNLSTPTYLSKPIKKLIGNGVLGYVLCCTDENTAYLYNFKEDGAERIQSAWNTWEFLPTLSAKDNSYEYFNIDSTLLILCKTDDDYRYHQLELAYSVANDNVDTSFDGTTETEYSYESSVKLPSFYPQLTSIRTPLNKALIKKITIEGEGSFDADVYRKDYDKTYTKSHTYGLQDLDLHIASRVNDVDVTIKDSTENDFKLTSVAVEALFSTTSKEMK